MAKHLQLGVWGEKTAKTFLLQKGFQILETNWRHQRAEVDIIAKEEGILVFIEVKTRSSDYFGPPESFVTPQKEKLLVRAAHAYMKQIGHDWEIRFDIVSILHKSNNNYQLEHLEDAFWPGTW